VIHPARVDRGGERAACPVRGDLQLNVQAVGFRPGPPEQDLAVFGKLEDQVLQPLSGSPPTNNARKAGKSLADCQPANRATAGTRLA
jgi:hypothetical protein